METPEAMAMQYCQNMNNSIFATDPIQAGNVANIPFPLAESLH